MTDSKNAAIPEEFTKVIGDFVGDLTTTFPEYVPFISKWWKPIEAYNYIDDAADRLRAYEKHKQSSIKLLFSFCQKKLPPRFFDILYQNEDMFKEESDIDTEFLPSIHFRNLWQCDISQKTKETMWKYLQLITFSIVGTLDNKDAFGDTAKMFEAINQDEFKSKLEETLSHMQGLFDMSGNKSDAGEGVGAGINMPDAEQLHEHITGMLDGKLGQLAREIAEDTANNLNMEFDDATDMKDVFQKLMKNPTKLMGLVKTVGDKLDSKIKTGDLKESELIAEATDMMNKMKNMPGMDNIQSMLSKMGMGNLAGMAGMAGMGGLGGLGGLGGGKVNMGAMQANLDQKMKLAKTKERILAKAEANAKAKVAAQLLAQQQQQVLPRQPQVSEEELIKLFASEEKQEKTPRGSKPQPNKKKGKK